MSGSTLRGAPIGAGSNKGLLIRLILEKLHFWVQTKGDLLARPGWNDREKKS